MALVGSVVFQWWVPARDREGILIAALLLITAASPWLLRLRYAQNRRQVPQAVRNRGPRVGALQFGFEMGTGSRTFMTTTMPHVVFVGLLLLVSPGLATLAGFGFGAGRALVPLLRSYGDRDVDWTESFDRWAKQIWLGTSLCALASMTVLAF